METIHTVDFDVKSSGGKDEGFFEEDESRMQSPNMSRSSSDVEFFEMIEIIE